jgi:cupin 2 domain-containing protein
MSVNARPEMSHLYADIPALLPEELVTILAESKDVRIERIVSKGHSSPENFWYDQATTEFVVLIQGEAQLQFEGERDTIVMGVGDYLIIPPHTRHKILRTKPDAETIWLTVHF